MRGTKKINQGPILTARPAVTAYGSHFTRIQGRPNAPGLGLKIQVLFLNNGAVRQWWASRSPSAASHGAAS